MNLNNYVGYYWTYIYLSFIVQRMYSNFLYIHLLFLSYLRFHQFLVKVILDFDHLLLTFRQSSTISNCLTDKSCKPFTNDTYWREQCWWLCWASDLRSGKSYTRCRQMLKKFWLIRYAAEFKKFQTCQKNHNNTSIF